MFSVKRNDVLRPRKLVSLPKSALRVMSTDLTSSHSGDISRDALVNNMSNVMIRNEENTACWTLSLVKLEEEDENLV